MRMMNGTPWAGMSKWSLAAVVVSLFLYLPMPMIYLLVFTSNQRHPLLLAWGALLVAGWIPLSILLLLKKPIDNLILICVATPLSFITAFAFGFIVQTVGRSGPGLTDAIQQDILI